MIRVEELVKRYKKADRNAVDGISFEVRAGEFFALLGPNGAGKTTTISILTTTLAPTGGRATIDGRDITRESSAVRKIVRTCASAPSSVQYWRSPLTNARTHATAAHRMIRASLI